jgi:hypothetical protein
MSASYFQDEKKEPVPAYVEARESEGEVKSFTALIEEGKIQSQSMLDSERSANKAYRS